MTRRERTIHRLTVRPLPNREAMMNLTGPFENPSLHRNGWTPAVDHNRDSYWEWDPELYRDPERELEDAISRLRMGGYTGMCRVSRHTEYTYHWIGDSGVMGMISRDRIEK